MARVTDYPALAYPYYLSRGIAAGSLYDARLYAVVLFDLAVVHVDAESVIDCAGIAGPAIAQDLGQHSFAGGLPSRSKPPVARIEEPLRAGPRKEVITLDEGDVVITFPENCQQTALGTFELISTSSSKKMQRRAKSSQKDEGAS